MVKKKLLRSEGYSDRLAELSVAARRMSRHPKADGLLFLAWTAYEACEQVAGVMARSRAARLKRA